MNRNRTTAAGMVLSLVAGIFSLSVVLASPAQSGQEVHPEWGKTSAPNGILKRRCKNYSYSYSLTPPDGLWGLETYLIGPGGKPLSSGAFAIDYNPESGSAKFRICRPTTRPGVFKIRAKLSVQKESGSGYQEGWLPVTKFRLRNRR